MNTQTPDDRYSFTLPTRLGIVGGRISEFMLYQNLPIMMYPEAKDEIRLPPNLQSLRSLVKMALDDYVLTYQILPVYVYITAKKSWVVAGNTQNRAGWHCDGFGTDDINYIWSDVCPTKYAFQDFYDISDDHEVSLAQFEQQINPDTVMTCVPYGLYRLDNTIVHAPPVVDEPILRSFVKLSFSNNRYNLENNSHNYLFNYDWEMYARKVTRNDTSRSE